MGCISSKGISRSMSIHERLSQTIHAVASGVLPGEEFRVSSSERERFIAFVKVASGKRFRSFQFVETNTEETTSMSIMAPDLNSGVEVPDGDEPKNRSTELAELRNAVSESDSTDQGSVSCRSYHTLEEFDELVEKMRLLEAKITGYASDGSDKSKPEAQTDQASSPLTEDTRNPPDKTRSDTTTLDNIATPATPTGLKRKAMARELKLLTLPSTGRAELSTSASLKGCIHAGADIYSANSYETPKFGSYAHKRRECTAFSPELVAAFEECMQQMEAEEQNILMQMGKISKT